MEADKFFALRYAAFVKNELDTCQAILDRGLAAPENIGSLQARVAALQRELDSIDKDFSVLK